MPVSTVLILWGELMSKITQTRTPAIQKKQTGTSDTPYQEIIAAFSKRRVIVLGDVMLDHYIWGEWNGFLPKPPSRFWMLAKRNTVWVARQTWPSTSKPWARKWV
jgi:hypothetical protein